MNPRSASRLFGFLFLAFVVVGVVSCAVTDPVMTRPEGGGASPLEVVGSLLGTVVPWAGTAAGAITSIYTAARGKKWKKAVQATAQGIEEMSETEEGRKVKKKLARKFEDAGVTPYVDSVLRVMGALRKTEGNGPASPSGAPPKPVS